jgi:hypothetical protein
MAGESSSEFRHFICTFTMTPWDLAKRCVSTFGDRTHALHCRQILRESSVIEPACDAMLCAFCTIFCRRRGPANGDLNDGNADEYELQRPFHSMPDTPGAERSNQHCGLLYEVIGERQNGLQLRVCSTQVLSDAVELRWKNASGNSRSLRK